MSIDQEITLSEYQSLAEFRYQLRRFLHFSEQAARSVGLEPQQHQLLLARQRRQRRIINTALVTRSSIRSRPGAASSSKSRLTSTSPRDAPDSLRALPIDTSGIAN